MFKFLRDAKSEIEHVVWPTPTETKKYMYYNISVIVVLAIFLMFLGYILQTSLSATRSLFPHEALIDTTDTVSQSELDDITEAIEKKQQTDALNITNDTTVTTETTDVAPVTEVPAEVVPVIAQ